MPYIRLIRLPHVLMDTENRKPSMLSYSCWILSFASRVPYINIANSFRFGFAACGLYIYIYIVSWFWGYAHSHCIVELTRGFHSIACRTYITGLMEWIDERCV